MKREIATSPALLTMTWKGTSFETWEEIQNNAIYGGTRAGPWAQLAQLALSGRPGVFARRGACRTLFALDLEDRILQFGSCVEFMPKLDTGVLKICRFYGFRGELHPVCEKTGHSSKNITKISGLMMRVFIHLPELHSISLERCAEWLKREIELLTYAMKKTFHLCLSAGDEAMFRDLEDYYRGFNSFALALYKTDSTGLAESFMSTHTHQLIQTARPRDFMHDFRLSYVMYFNRKYQRKGSLGESQHFSLEVVGHHHFLAAASYSMRNPVHHGVTPTPFAYEHCSANAIFRREMGKFLEAELLPAQHYARFLGKRAEYPSIYKMTRSGVFTRESVLDIAQMESRYGTARAFNYYMTRKSSEEWEAEQQRDENGLPPVNIVSIEHGVHMHDITRMSVFESGKADYRRISDIELCTELDILARNRYGRHSVYQLTTKEKLEIAGYLYKTRHLSESQIRRCLVLPK